MKDSFSYSRDEISLFNAFSKLHFEGGLILPDDEIIKGTISGEILNELQYSLKPLFLSLERENGEKFQCIFGYVEDVFPVGYSGLQGNVHICGISLGLIALIDEFSKLIFSNNIFFQDIKGISEEDFDKTLLSSTPVFNFVNDHILGKKPDNILSTGHIYPKNKFRMVASKILFGFMMRFVWLHEIAHCTNGHVGFKNESNDNLLLDGAVSNSDNKSETTDNFWLEMDADTTALLMSCLDYVGNQEALSLEHPFDNDTLLRLNIFAVNAVIWIFEEFDKAGTIKNGPNHPIPQERIQNILRLVIYRINQTKGKHRISISKITSDLSQLSILSPNMPELEKIWMNVARDFVNQKFMKQEKELNEYRTILKKWAYNKKSIK